jgi:acetyl-CoA C-acetyltransferase
MRNVYIAGTAMTPVGEHYTRSLADLASEALRGALGTLAPSRVDALYVANALGGELAGQAQLGAAVASATGMRGVEAIRVEAAGASGGAALRQAYLAIASGAADLVVVLGVEKVSDKLDGAAEAGLALASDSDFEAAQGLTLAGQWALLMRRYMHEHGVEAAAFAPFPINAHANGVGNPLAMYRFAINADKYRKAQLIASPLNMLDCPSLGDGAAALVLASEELAQDLAPQPIRIAGSALATDSLALHHRADLLHLAAVERSTRSALAQAGLAHDAVDVLELSDPHGITALLALESAGFVPRGEGLALAASGALAPGGALPLATSGGYKARGDLLGATGVYQAAEIAQQLRGEAGARQVAGARVGLAQCLGGVAATAVTHILIAA